MKSCYQAEVIQYKRLIRKLRLLKEGKIDEKIFVKKANHTK